MNIHNVPELNYLTQIVFLLFEDLSKPEKSDLRYRVYVHFSPGVRTRDERAIPSEAKTTIPDPCRKQSERLPGSAGRTRRSEVGHSSTVLSKPLDALDMARPKELVVRRLSEQHSGGKFTVNSEGQLVSVNGAGRMKSSSLTDALPHSVQPEQARQDDTPNIESLKSNSFGERGQFNS